MGRVVTNVSAVFLVDILASSEDDEEDEESSSEEAKLLGSQKELRKCGHQQMDITHTPNRRRVMTSVCVRA